MGGVGVVKSSFTSTKRWSEKVSAMLKGGGSNINEFEVVFICGTKVLAMLKGRAQQASFPLKGMHACVEWGCTKF